MELFLFCVKVLQSNFSCAHLYNVMLTRFIPVNSFKKNYKFWQSAILKRHFDPNNAIFVKVSIRRQTPYTLIMKKKLIVGSDYNCFNALLLVKKLK